MPLVSRTRATLRRAEFGFLGVVVYTRVHTPRRCGAATRFLRPLPDFRPGVASFLVFGLRPLRTSWEVVGIRRERVAMSDWAHPGSRRVVWRSPEPVEIRMGPVTPWLRARRRARRTAATWPRPPAGRSPCPPRR